MKHSYQCRFFKRLIVSIKFTDDFLLVNALSSLKYRRTAVITNAESLNIIAV